MIRSGRLKAEGRFLYATPFEGDYLEAMQFRHFLTLYEHIASDGRSADVLDFSS
jgi:hypothetical protein